MPCSSRRWSSTSADLADMSKCLLCGSCFDKCPNLVPTDEIVMAARREIAERKGTDHLRQGGLHGPEESRPDEMGGQGRQRPLRPPLQEGPRAERPAAALSRAPSSRRTAPFPRSPPSPSGTGTPSSSPERRKNRLVAFFTGCMINYMYPEIGEALLKILQFMGMNVLIPADQGCCGLPALSAGDGATVETLAERNLAAFAQAGARGHRHRLRLLQRRHGQAFRRARPRERAPRSQGHRYPRLSRHETAWRRDSRSCPEKRISRQ